MPLIETLRLTLSKLSYDDDEFIFELLNDPSWLKYIGNRNINHLDDARRYISEGPIASYQQHGFGLYLVTLKESQTKIGLCGLLKRDHLDHPDLGFSFLPAFVKQGYAYEASQAILSNAKTELTLKTILASTAPDNSNSIKLLERLGFKFKGIEKFSNEQGESRFYSLKL